MKPALLPLAALGVAAATAVWADPAYGQLQFSAPTDFLVGGFPGPIRAHDLDGDGHLDLVTADHQSNQLSLLFGDGAGGFPVSIAIPVGNDPHGLEVADLDGDGYADLVSANNDASVTVLLSNGVGGYIANTMSSLPSNTRSCMARDLDGDGILDLVVSATAGVLVFVGQGNGAFGASSSTWPAGPSPVTFADAADLNADGKTDTLVANQLAGQVSVLLGDGSGGFLAPSSFSVGSSHTMSVVLGDINLDGMLDAVSGNYTPNVSVLLGDGTGILGPPTVLTTNGAPYSLHIRDLDLDGFADLAIPDETAKRVVVLRGDGAGGFGSILEFPNGGRSIWLTAGDLDEDGWPDLAVANAHEDSVSILVNKSVPTCSPLPEYGNGCPGLGGFTPKLSMCGNPAPGGALTLTLSGTAPQSLAVVLLGAFQASIPAAGTCWLLVHPVFPIAITFPTGGTASVAGSGLVEIPFTVPMGTLPAVVQLQGFVGDSSNPWGYAASNGVTVSIQ